MSKIKLDKKNFMRGLFEKFNTRYDTLNERLLELTHWEFEVHRDHNNGQSQSLQMLWEELFEFEPTKKPKAVAVAFDYLNLCSEEYYWYKEGFIEERVWKCWHDGMLQWYSDSLFLKKIIERDKKNHVPYYNREFLSLGVQLRAAQLSSRGPSMITQLVSIRRTEFLSLEGLKSFSGSRTTAPDMQPRGRLAHFQAISMANGE